MSMQTSLSCLVAGLNQHPRRWHLLGILVCVCMFAVAFWLQFVLQLEPCPLCILQRIALFTALSLFVCLAIWHPKNWYWHLLPSLGALAGIVLAGRHLWLQSLPADQVPACGPGLDYLLDVFPLWDVLTSILSGSGECAKISASWLGLSIPAWTLLGFVALVGFNGILAWQIKRHA